MLLDIIKEFIASEKIDPIYWELIITMRPSMIRGSLSSAVRSQSAVRNIPLLQLPDVQDDPLDVYIYQMCMEELEKDRDSIITSLRGSFKDARTIAADYVEATTERLRILAMPKGELLKRALASPDLANTGVCGETANLLARILGVEPSDGGDLETLVKTLTMDELPPIHMLVSIGDSHKFLILKNGSDIILLQSWIGRFSLTTWMNNGQVFWKLNDFVQALSEALPTTKDNRINKSYNLLFNVPGVDPTPSPHTASEVSVTVYITPSDIKSVRDNLRGEYEAGQQKWMN
ncbi:MAG TPA: hypothetical protein VI260_13705 [Blastocatellia bacterium]|jgi:hypothetical protein